MSTKPINHNEDIQRLLADDYDVVIENNCLVVRGVPYLDENLTVKEDGVLVCAYPMNEDHTFYFSEIPFTVDKKPLHVAGNVKGWNGFAVTAYLSFKKSDGQNPIPYTDHYDKVTHYILVIGAHAQKISGDKKITARKGQLSKSIQIEETPFEYEDLNSSRAGINHLNEKFKNHKIAIIGVGGTGSYVLDFVSKSYVSEVHLYDDDTFHKHNAFRTPGSASKESVESLIKKVDYLHGVYSKMRKGIIPHEYRVTPEIIDAEFNSFNFVFVCIDANESKRAILLKLIEKGISFIDCGIAADEVEGSLNGTIRLTTITQNKNDHFSKRIHCEGSGVDGYDSNIQIAELNALTATLAVIKWKRIFGFYHNHETEHHTTYMFNSNSISNDERV